MDNEFYLQIEEPVREIVRALRDAGINTECSCGHEMYVQCQTLDPTTELPRIYNVMSDLGINMYQVDIHRQVLGGHVYDSLVILVERKD